MNRATPQKFSRNKVIVVIALLAAVIFGLVLGILLWTNDSFPSQTRPFDQYASVESSIFNGTEFSFGLRWLSANYTPLYAQLSSPVSDTATTDVCNLNLTSAYAGEVIVMPFGLSGPSTSLSNVDLSIAVKSVVDGTEFTIVYNTPSINATAGNIQPQNLSCGRSSAPM
jgi:hypothetical protein